MSVEAKIKELLGRKSDSEQLTEESHTDATSGMSGVNNNAGKSMKRDSSKAGTPTIAGDTTQPRQGSSADAEVDDLDDATTAGPKVSAKASKQPVPMMKGDAKSMKTQANEESEEDEDEMIEEEAESIDIKSQLMSIFGEDLSEEFTSKATSIFEAAVIARVNDEMERVTYKLEEQAVEQLIEYKEALVEKVDGYLNYVVEQWMEENTLAIENGLRTEIAEDFISGLKTLFKEHYIEVPEEKYDVMEELQATAESLTTELDEAVTVNIELIKELNELKRDQIFDEQTKDLASTEVEKLKRLVEGVELESEDLYREKVSVIKENYFPKGVKVSPEQVLVEDSSLNTETFDTSSLMAQYAQSISRTVKSR